MRSWNTLIFSLLLLTACGGLGEEGSAPRLDPIDNQWSRVGEKLSLIITASDADDDPLTFKIAGRPENAQFIALDDGRSALFQWIPEPLDGEAGGKEHRVEFFVLDDAGLWDSQQVTITVMPQAAAQFLNPPGYVLDLAEENHIEFLVQVKDDSATQVDIAIEQGPEGAYLEQSGSKEAYFYWRPTDEQISTKLFWYVRFSAAGYAPDAAHPGQQNRLYEMQQDIAIVITNPDYAGCPGSPPTISHTILADQHPEPGEGYEVQAKVTESDSSVERVEVFYAYQENAEPEEFKSALLASEDGLHFQGEIPKVTAGSGLLMYYYLEATDNDDYAGVACDHVSRLPKKGTYAFVAYDPGYTSCMEDPYEPNDDFMTAHFFMDGGEYTGLRLCNGGEDFFGFVANAPSMRVSVQTFGNGDDLRTEVQDGAGNPMAAVQAGETSISVPVDNFATNVLVVRLYSASGLPITYNLTVTPEFMECSADGQEPNEGPEQAPLLGEGTFNDLAICAGDEDWFRLEVPTGTELSAVVSHAAGEGDLDLFLIDSDGESIVESAQTSLNDETVEYSAPDGGTYYLRVIGYLGAVNSYHLTIAYTTQSLQCEEDNYAPNQYLDQAIMIPPDEHPNLVSCPGKEDWYQVGLNGGETLTIEVTGQNATLPLTLYDTLGEAPLCTGSTNGSQTTVNCAIPGPGNYPFVVANSGGKAVPYSMVVAVTEDTSTCQEDRFENNDGPDSAAEVLWSITTWLKACGMDEDWFFFLGYPMERVNIGLLFDPADGVVDAALYESSLNAPLAWTASADGMVVMQLDLPAGDTYYIQVSGNNAGGNVPYNLFVWFD